MNAIKFILAGVFILSLSSCGGSDPELAKKVEELNKKTEELKAVAMQFKLNQESVNGAVGRLSNSLNMVNNAASNVEDKISRNQVVLNKNVEALSDQQLKLEKQLNVFNQNLAVQLKEFNNKLSTLENLYIKEGVVELTGEDGKINVEKFPALTETEVEFMEEINAFESSGWITLNGRVQSKGKWVINGKSYQLFDFMTFYVEMSRTSKTSDGEATLYAKKVTFKNTHGEVVTTTKVEGYLLSNDGKEKTKWQVRELESGKRQAFISKGTKAKLVLSEPLNLAIRK